MSNSTPKDDVLLDIKGLKIQGFSDERWHDIVKGVDLKLCRGQIMGLIGESGAGMVKVTMTGGHSVRRVEIDDSLMADDKDMLEDLVSAAFNDAVRRVEAQNKEKMGALTGGMQLPPGMKMPF